MIQRRLIIGITFWVLCGAAAWTAIRRETGPNSYSPGSLARDVSEWTLGLRTDVRARSAQRILLLDGAPILMEISPGKFRQVGMVRGIRRPPFSSDSDNQGPPNLLSDTFQLTVYDRAINEVGRDFVLEYHWTPESLDWVVRTMLPEGRRREIQDLMEQEWKTHKEEILRSMVPVVQQSIQRAVAAIEGELPAVIERHRNEFSRLGDRYRIEMVREQLLPLVRDNILPIVEDEGRPLATLIGQKLWERVSLWSFTWRYFYDVSPLPERNAVQKEFNRFLEEEAMPEIRMHSDEFVDVIERVLSRVARDPAVSETVRASLRQVAQDPEFHSIVWNVLREAVVENQQLRASMMEYWSSDGPQAAIREASMRFEPAVRKIGDLLFGSRDGGISPEFARVLRAQILLKDRQWLILKPAGKSKIAATDKSPSGKQNDSVTIELASEPMSFPIQFETAAPSPLSELP